jgi:hypothetical protein
LLVVVTCRTGEIMGHLIYGERAVEIVVDDRALAHLQIVILQKLRRLESFAFSWVEPTTTGSGRSTIWLHPNVTLQFHYLGSRIPSINQVWLTELTELAHSNAGLRLIPEPAAPSPSGRAPEIHRR